MSATNVTCPTDCSSSPGAMVFNYCDANTNHGEADLVFIASQDAADLVNSEDLAEWLTRIDNTGVDTDDIRKLHFIGEKPAPDANYENLGGGNQKTKEVMHTLTGKIVETGDENYQAMRKFQCGGKYKIWWTVGKYLYGGNTGVLARVSMRLVSPLERTENEYFMTEISWDENQDPNRVDNPFTN